MAMSDRATRRAFDTHGVVCKTHIGGQALIEGIMMRGRYNWAVAVREPSGDIYTEEHDLASGRERNTWMYWPVVRGVVAFVESLALGYRALEIAGAHAYDLDEDGGDDEAAPSGEAESVARPRSERPEAIPLGGSRVVVDDAARACGQAVQDDAEGSVRAEPSRDESQGGLGKGVMTVSMVLGLVLGVLLFAVAPAVVTNLLVGDYTKGTFAWNVVDGLIRVAIFLIYLAAISLMPDIRRMFAYHGAEHETIHCYEHGLELTPANAQTFPRLHVRCGTAFLLMTMIIAILVFTIVPVDRFIMLVGVTNGATRLAIVICSRIVLMPLVAGLAYEVTVKWAGNRPENPLVRVVLWPGLQLQRLTTNQPDEGMLECAIAAMGLVLERERAEAREAEVQAASAGEGVIG